MTSDLAQLRDRVKLYLMIMLVIDGAAYVSDGINWLIGKELPELALQYAALRWCSTGLMVGGYLIARFAPPRRLGLIALESAVTIALAIVYTQLGSAFLADTMPTYGPGISLVGLLLLLSVRTALVPSPALRTAAIGAAAMVCWYLVGRETIASLDPVALESMLFMGAAMIAATAITSRVIYGLRAEVREARRLGAYELVRKLGEGGMGVVYEATHRMLRRPTAIKLLPIERVGEDTVARFEREVQQTSRLEHPNSVYIYDYGRTPDGQFYYAMEYLDGLTLTGLIDAAGPIGADRAAAIMRQAASALAEAHDLGLVHRDVKPANIMLCERAGVADSVKVLDFGLVKAIDDPEIDGELTGADVVVGTPHYLAPEAITDPDAVGPAADVYALAAVGFFLLTGREVFLGASVIEVCSKHLEAAPPPPSEVLGEPIDPGLEALIARCLSKRPGDRPADGAALAAAIDALGLDGWSAADARAWWLEHRREPAPEAPPSSTGRTQIEIDVKAR